MRPHYPEEYSKKHADSPVQPDRLLWSRGEGPICRDEHSCSAGFSSKHSKYWTVQLSMLLVFGLMTFLVFFGKWGICTQLWALLGTLSPPLVAPLPQSFCTSWNWKESFSNKGNSSYSYRNQSSGAPKSFAITLIKIGRGFLLMQNPYIPVKTPVRGQCFCCPICGMARGGWAAVGYPGGDQISTSFAEMSCIHKHICKRSTDEIKA